MKRSIAVFAALVLGGCTGPEHVSSAEFKIQYVSVGQAQSVRNVTYLGRRDGRAFIQVSTRYPLNVGWSDHVVYVELAELEPEFLDALPDTEWKNTPPNSR